MLYKNIILVCLSLAICFSSVYADDTLSISGAADLHDKQYQSISISGSLEANKITVSKSASISGSATIKNSTIGALNISGDASLDKSKITSKVSISGSIKIINSIINGKNLSCSGNIISKYTNFNTQISVSGDLFSEQDKFNHEVTTSGNIAAKQSIFYKPIVSSASKLELDNSIVYNSIINKNNSPLNPPCIILKKTTIHGKIVFDKSSGTVMIDKKTKIIGGVVNGRIEFKS